ncbi:MAG: NAD-dependent epimerase [Pseudomonadota bacterium]
MANQNDPARWVEKLNAYRPIVVTGAAGFIGFHLAERLMQAGLPVVGVDNLNDYYDPALKDARLKRLRQYAGFSFTEMDLADIAAFNRLIGDVNPAHVIHLAAQAGVRYSIQNPHAYAQSNLVGFLNVLEACRHANIDHLIYASSSSVYGGNAKQPFAVADPVDHPVSLYAATKKSNELMAHTYSHLYGLPATGLRFFTVYGPWGRPDMAYFLFTKAILAGEPIKVFNHGDMQRDFTYIDDIVEGILRLIPRAPAADPDTDRPSLTPGTSWAPHRIYNIGNDNPERLGDLIAHLEDLLGATAERDLQPMPPGDVKATWAEMSDLKREIGFQPTTSLRDGLANFVTWYREFYDV